MAHRPRDLVIDTCVLLELLVLDLLADGDSLYGSLSHLVKELSRPDAERDFRLFISRHSVRRTAPGVAVELERHIRNQMSRAEANTLLPDLYRRLSLQEDHAALATLNGEELRAFGPVDATLLALVRQAAPSSTLLTIDRALYAHCRSSGLKVRWVTELD